MNHRREFAALSRAFAIALVFAPVTPARGVTRSAEQGTIAEPRTAGLTTAPVLAERANVALLARRQVHTVRDAQAAGGW